MQVSKRASALLWQIILGGVLLDLILVAAILIHAPILLEAKYLSTALFTIILLLIFGVVGTGLPLLIHSVNVKNALWQATRMGLLIGLIFVIDITVEYFVDLNQSAGLFSTFGFMSLIFLTFVGVGALGSHLTGKWFLGVLCSIWSALHAALIALFFGMVVNFFFLSRLEAISAADFIHSGMHDPAAFTFLGTLDNASNHLFEVPILAAIFGALGALIFIGLITLQRKSQSPAKRIS